MTKKNLGGKRPGAGRPATGQKALRHSITLENEAWSALEKIGNGNASRGIRKMLEEKKMISPVGYVGSKCILLAKIEHGENAQFHEWQCARADAEKEAAGFAETQSADVTVRVYLRRKSGDLRQIFIRRAVA